MGTEKRGSKILTKMGKMNKNQPNSTAKTKAVLTLRIGYKTPITVYKQVLHTILKIITEVQISNLTTECVFCTNNMSNTRSKKGRRNRRIGKKELFSTIRKK